MWNLLDRGKSGYQLGKICDDCMGVCCADSDTYTANLASLLTVQQLRPAVNDLHERCLCL